MMEEDVQRREKIKAIIIFTNTASPFHYVNHLSLGYSYNKNTTTKCKQYDAILYPVSIRAWWSRVTVWTLWTIKTFLSLLYNQRKKLTINKTSISL